ncbi:MAG: hypothetical protein KatS3mg003_2159 [Candidatus Nitrosocaldaceae archaeon]|nr:MAG: hypothetical protein KatS3mg003_2159 [Candidatus Nitrosocaldaceae archaeon]
MISAIGNANSKLVVEFINALRIYGVGEGKVKYYAQYSYSIL